jgi:hypothetical protein
MLKTEYKIVLLLLLIAPFIFAQEKSFTIGANASLMVPVGTLSKRFLAAPGATLYFSVKRGNPEWGGSLEYFKYDRENTGKLFIKRSVPVDTVSGVPREETFQIGLPKLSMFVEVIGAAVNAKYELLNTGILSTSIGFGAGIYHWKAERSEYYDTMNVQTSRGPKVADVLRVPKLGQDDWSGGFNLGADVGFRVFDPVTLNVGARYKLIVGELWPTLALDLENVSTFQMIDLRAGLSVDF